MQGAPLAQEEAENGCPCAVSWATVPLARAGWLGQAGKGRRVAGLFLGGRSSSPQLQEGNGPAPAPALEDSSLSVPPAPPGSGETALRGGCRWFPSSRPV